MYLSGSTPLIEVMVRSEYITGGLQNRDEPALIFGVSSIEGRALGFHVHLQSGAVFWRLPVSAFYVGKHAPPITIGEAQFWDCLGYNIAITEFRYLRARTCTVKLKSGQDQPGQYKFTVDWANSGEEFSGYAEMPDEHKCAHIIQLNNGNFVAYPNNRIWWDEASFVKPLAGEVLYKPQEVVHYAEKDSFKIRDGYFY